MVHWFGSTKFVTNFLSEILIRLFRNPYRKLVILSIVRLIGGEIMATEPFNVYVRYGGKSKGDFYHDTIIRVPNDM